jgi:5,6-dimethylbenzimidazole synthase
MTQKKFQYSQTERDAIYRVIYERRDMRHFSAGTIDEKTLWKLLNAAHHAPSVGYMQPWRFIRISDQHIRQEIHALVEQERPKTAAALGSRGDDFMALKLEGIMECAELLVVALADGREKYIVGRRTLPEMDLASAACAIENMWLAARAEGLGMGWVSLYDPEELAKLLNMPVGSKPIGVFCIGPVDEFYDKPMLEAVGWKKRAELKNLVFENSWDQLLATKENK